MAPAAHPGIDAALRGMVEAGELPGATYAVGTPSGTVFAGGVGRLASAPRDEALPEDPIYDLASLTKPLATAALVLRLAASGRLGLDDAVRDHLPAWRGDDRAGVTLRDLLLHRSGLPAWEPLYLRSPDPGAVFDYLGTRPLESEPGTRAVYSCPGYIVAGGVLERVTGRGLTELFAEEVAAPLGLRCTGFRPDPSLRPRIAPTEQGNAHERSLAGEEGSRDAGWPEGIIRGVVHDRNARHLGGAAGNAGLFGDALDVDALLRGFLVPGLLDDRARGVALEPDEGRGAEVRTVGFQSARTEGSAAGPALSADAVGHTGFTGTSAWLDPEASRTFVLLTNRVHPRHRPSPMHPLRRAFHGVAVSALRDAGL